MTDLPETPREAKNASKTKAAKPAEVVAFARHARIKVQSKASAVWGLTFKALGLVLGATIAVTGISVFDLSNTIKANGIVLAGSKQITEADLKGPINMLLVGSDTRVGQGAGYGNDTSELADVLILLHISADRKNAVALSFPRDLMVEWPACPSTSGGPGYLPQSMGQINATIANGGPGCTLLTIEKLTGVSIPYLALIDFKGVIEMSNAIGGVDVCVAEAINDKYTQTYLEPGEYTLQGKDALQFLRTRHGVGDGSDLSRISNQQTFLTSLVRKVKSQGVLGNPVALYSLANAAARNMKLSESLTDINVMVALAGALKDIDLDKITFLQVPSRGGLPAPYSGRVMPIYEQANVLFEKIATDQPLILAAANTGSGAVIKDGATPAPSASPSASSSATAGSSAAPVDETLPDWARGTNAATTTCSG